MTNGVVMMAYDNGGIHYLDQALFNAKQIKRLWGDISITIFTDSDTLSNKETIPGVDFILNSVEDTNDFNHRSYYLNGERKVLDYKNKNRTRIYELTPYDNTLLLDTDYIIQSKVLSGIFDTEDIIKCNKVGRRLDHTYLLEDERLDHMGIPMYWMTVLFFKKDPITKLVFDMMDHIKENWNFYKTMYRFKNQMYRNDYALSIAIHTINGHNENSFVNSLPNKELLTGLESDEIIKWNPKENEIVFHAHTRSGYNTIASKVKDTDVHIMNKYSLDQAIKTLNLGENYEL